MNILITRHDKIGDFITTLPTFYVAKKNFPEAKIVALVSKVNYPLAKAIDFIDDVILYDDDPWRLARAIRAKKIDVSISCFIDTNLAIALFFSRVKKRFAPATKFAQVFFNNRIKQRRSQVRMREFEYNLELLQTFNNEIDIEFEKPLIKFSPEHQKAVLDYFKNEVGLEGTYRYVGFHVGYGGSSDGNLKLEDYIRLAKKASEFENVKVVFTFGPDDGETKKLVEEKVDFDAIIYDSRLQLIDFCNLLSSFELFVSTSTGPMHLAGAVNTQTISFFGDSLFASANRWATISDEENQNNYSIPADYDEELYEEIEQTMIEVLS